MLDSKSKENLHTLAKKNYELNDTSINAQKYAAAAFDNTYLLGFRELPLLFEKYSSGNNAVDYGCGTGRSTRFLRKNGFQVIGVDISKKMLEQAKKTDKDSYYIHTETGCIPVFDNTCDLVLSTFVMFTISSKEKLLKIFKEVYRALKDNGVFIIVTGSEELYSHEWLSYATDYSQNKNLKSGDTAMIKLKDLDIEFINYYWTNKDYIELFSSLGFKLLEKYNPYGKPNEKNWVSETRYSPYVIYVLQK